MKSLIISVSFQTRLNKMSSDSIFVLGTQELTPAVDIPESAGHTLASFWRRVGFVQFGHSVLWDRLLPVGL